MYISRRIDGRWDGQATSNRPVAQQPGREFTSAFATSRAGDAAFPTNAKSPEVRCRSLVRPQPFQPGTPPLQPEQFQAQRHSDGPKASHAPTIKPDHLMGVDQSIAADYAT